MTLVLTPEALMFALLLFGLRVLNNAVGTVRLIFVMQQRRLWAAALGFLEAFIFAIVFANVVSDLSNVVNMIAYCGGFAVGGYVGMAIEARYVTGYMIATVIARVKGHELALALRERGYGVTESHGEGRDGMVTMLRSVVARRDLTDLLDTVRQIHPDAFVSVEEARTVQHGWIRAAGNHQSR